ncbi:hypothetical protein X748_12900 [Mesorhizobium sp. LNJC386A00]|nr:hypothetical protein X752_16345 [Mesorhizobium sp. LNJC398B00]ESY36492.1 hypothetical protein X748_12900 [Mesorhizobium sp. LNJC386A00]
MGELAGNLSGNRPGRSRKRAENLLHEDCGVAMNLALCCRIRSAQRRVVETRQRLTKIDPSRAN